MQCERASSTDALLRLDPLSLNLNSLSLFLSLSSKQPRPFPPAHGGSGFLSQCFQDAAFVVLPSTLLALAALLSAARARGSSGGGGDPRRRQRRRRGSSPASSPSSPSSPLRVAALRSALLSSLSGVAMVLFFAYSATQREGAGRRRAPVSFVEALLALPPRVAASGCALAAAGLALARTSRRRRSSLPLVALSFASAAATLVAAGSSWVVSCLLLAAEREEATGPSSGRRRRGGGGDGDASLVLVLARACFLSLASASLWACSICSYLARRREREGKGEDASNDGAQQEPLLSSEASEPEETPPPPPPPPRRRPRPSSSWSMAWVSPLLSVGSLRQLTEADLFSVPERDAPQEAASELARAWAEECRRSQSASKSSSSPSPPSLSRCVWRVYGTRWLSLGLLKLLSDSLNFAGPMLLNALVGFVTPRGDGDGSDAGGISPPSPLLVFLLPHRGSPAFGFAAAALLALAAVSKAFLNSRYSFGMASLSAALRSSLGSAVHGAALAGGGARSPATPGGASRGGQRGEPGPSSSSSPPSSLSDPSSSSAPPSFSDGDVATLASVDVDRAASGPGAAHELWSQPMQVAAALALLYGQVRLAFLAGVAVVLALIPLNRLLATRIGAATREMMVFKGARLAVVAELARGDGGGAAAIKASGWEAAFGARVRAARAREVRALAARKLLDALCVYFWACSSLLVTLSTLGAAAVSGGGGASLGSAAVFTSLALFGVLVAPLNALPWVLTGVIEASVSLRRLQEYFSCRGGAGLVGEVEKVEKEEEEEEVDGGGSGETETATKRVLLGFVGRDEHALSSRQREQQRQGEGEEEHDDEDDGVAVALSHASFSWSCSSETATTTLLPPPSPSLSLLRRRSPAFQNPLPTLCDISLTLNSGHLIAVVGPTGSGKSSLIAALAGVRMFFFSGKEREATEQSERNRETHSYSPPLSNSTNRR